MKIGYYIKNSPTKEIISNGSFATLEDAITTFAQLKNLPIDSFLGMFSVVMLKMEQQILYGGTFMRERMLQAN